MFRSLWKKKNAFAKHEHEIELAFTCGGVDYYQFKNFSDTPPLRALKTMVYYEEMRMKCTVDYLHLHVDAIDELLKSSRIDIFEIKKLNDQLKQRLDIAIDTEILMKVASIVFFDKQENIEDYDFSYNKRKIENWKKNKADAFFLLQPVQELFPVLKDFPGNLTSYITVVEALNKKHLANLLQVQPGRETRI